VRDLSIPFAATFRKPKLTRFILYLLLLALPLQVSAQCGGHDLRAQLSAQASEQMGHAIDLTPYPQGNHWVATKGDKTLHLIGTLHIYDPRMDPVMDRLGKIVTAADVILLEATPVEEKALQDAIKTRPELVLLTTGPTLLELMSEEDWARLSQAASDRGIPPFMASKFQPWYLALMMGVPGCALKDAAAGARGLDRLIIERASEAGVPLRALEDYNTLFKLFGTDPLEEQVKMLTLSILPNQVSEDALYTLKEFYFDEQSAGAWEFSRQLSYAHIAMPRREVDTLFAELEDILLTQRNLAWMPRILAAPERNIVIAVGGAHLIGETGLLQLLENEGFTLVRKPF
jgi:uncharacterized protein YbaP (TraB family)